MVPIPALCYLRLYLASVSRLVLPLLSLEDEDNGNNLQDEDNGINNGPDVYQSHGVTHILGEEEDDYPGNSQDDGNDKPDEVGILLLLIVFLILLPSPYKGSYYGYES